MSFEKHMQNSVGASYDLRTILDNLSVEEIEQSVNEFVDLKISITKRSMLIELKNNRRFESGIDKIGFVYISQLEDIFNQLER